MFQGTMWEQPHMAGPTAAGTLAFYTPLFKVLPSTISFGLYSSHLLKEKKKSYTTPGRMQLTKLFFAHFFTYRLSFACILWTFYLLIRYAPFEMFILARLAAAFLVLILCNSSHDISASCNSGGLYKVYINVLILINCSYSNNSVTGTFKARSLDNLSRAIN